MRPKGYLAKSKRLVVKVGTSNITDEKSRLDQKKIKKLVDEVVGLRRRGKEVVIVTSGAIGAGMGRLGLSRRPTKMSRLQGAAAIGQGILMNAYGRHFDKHGQPVAQILASREAFTDPVRYRNFRNTMASLLEWGAVPIINENDSVAVEEIKLGDNDNLAALVAVGIKADLLVILSDVDGLCTGDPNASEAAELVSTVERVTPEVERLAGMASRGFGGMLTKVRSAKVVTKAGIPMIVANGNERNVLKRLLAGEELGTIFLPGKLRK